MRRSRARRQAARPPTVAALCAMVAASLLLLAPAEAAAQSGRAGPARANPATSPATVGVVSPRPAAASDHEPRLRPGRSQTAARAGTFGPNVAHPPNVGGPVPRIPHLPGPFTRVRFGGHLFYYCLGAFYVYDAGGYAMVEPPAGTVVRTLPRGHETLRLGDRELHYFDGVFYERDGRRARYVVVPAPAGAVVTHLPRDAVEVEVRGRLHHFARGVYYLELERDGERAYVVVAPY